MCGQAISLMSKHHQLGVQIYDHMEPAVLTLVFWIYQVLRLDDEACLVCCFWVKNVQSSFSH